VVLAAPPEANLRLLRRIARSAAPGLVVTDVGSVKRPICREAARLGLAGFVGGHPMAGSEAAGFAASSPDLFHGRPWILTGGSERALRKVRVLVRCLGARPVLLSAREHIQDSCLRELCRGWGMGRGLRREARSRGRAAPGPGGPRMARFDPAGPQPPRAMAADPGLESRRGGPGPGRAAASPGPGRGGTTMIEVPLPPGQRQRLRIVGAGLMSWPLFAAVLPLAFMLRGDRRPAQAASGRSIELVLKLGAGSRVATGPSPRGALAGRARLSAVRLRSPQRYSHLRRRADASNVRRRRSVPGAAAPSRRKPTG
jgi:hypothetical protein